MKFKRKSKLAEWQERCKSGTEKCAKCGETRSLTVDHIVPVAILSQFLLGDKSVESIIYNYEENFEILCRYCNYTKQSRLDMRNPKTFSVLRKVMDEVEKERP